YPKDLQSATVRQQFLDSRRELLRNGLQAAEREREHLTKGKPLTALPAILRPLLERTLRDWQAEAASLREAAELADFHTKCALGIVSGQAAQEEAAAADPLSVSARLQKLTADLPEFLNVPETRAHLENRRLQALRVGLTSADRASEELLKK